MQIEKLLLASASSINTELLSRKREASIIMREHKDTVSSEKDELIFRGIISLHAAFTKQIISARSEIKDIPPKL